MGGCQSVTNPLVKIEPSADIFTAEKEKALVVISGYYQKLQQSDYAGASEFYSDGWYEAMSKVETEDFLRGNDEKLGKTQSYTLESWESKKYEELNGGRGGFYVTFTHSVQHEKHKADEVVTLFKETADEQYRIFRHDLNSEGFDATQ